MITCAIIAEIALRGQSKGYADKLEKAAKAMLERHREEDGRAVESDLRAKETQRLARLESDAAVSTPHPT